MDKADTTTFRVVTSAWLTQGSSFLATLGWIIRSFGIVFLRRRKRKAEAPIMARAMVLGSGTWLALSSGDSVKLKL